MAQALTGRVALVTGAAKGIGAGIAKAMSSAGASVVVNFASDQPGAERLVAEIDGAGGKAFAIQANVSVVAGVERLLAEAVATFGPLDILVNNASVFAFASSNRRIRGRLGRDVVLDVHQLLVAADGPGVGQLPGDGDECPQRHVGGPEAAAGLWRRHRDEC